jgi:hypothetical protein
LMHCEYPTAGQWEGERESGSNFIILKEKRKKNVNLSFFLFVVFTYHQQIE